MSSNPFAEIEITASDRSLPGKLNSIRGTFASFFKSIESGAAGAAKSFGKSLSGAMGGALKGFGFGSVAGLGMQASSGIVSALTDGFDSAMDFERSLTRLQIEAERTPEAMEAFRKSVHETAVDTGLSSRSISEAAEAYVGLTGDMEGAEKQVRLWARAAQASSTPIAEIAELSAHLSQNLGITAEQSEAAFSALIVEGHKGAVHLSDFAAQLSGVAPQFAEFAGGKGVDGLRQMGAAFQAIQHGFKNADETATGFRSLMTEITKHAVALHKAGVEIYDSDPKTGVKTLKNFHDIVLAITNSKLMKDPTALQKALGREEAARTFEQLRLNLGLYDQLYAAAQDTGAVQRDFEAKMASPAQKWDTALNKLKEKMAEVFTPERIQKFADALTYLVDKTAKLVGYMEKLEEGMPGTDANYDKTMDTAAAQYGVDERAEESTIRAAGGDIHTAAGRESLREVAGSVVKNVGGPGFGSAVDPRKAAAEAVLADVAMYESWAAQLPKGRKTYDPNYARGEVGDFRHPPPVRMIGADLSAAATRIASAITSALSKQPIVVKIDSDAALHAVRSAPRARGPRG